MRFRNLKFIIRDNLTEPFCWFLAKTFLKEDFLLFTHGKSRFYGSQEMLNLIEESLLRLREIDEDLFIDLGNTPISHIQEIKNVKFAKMNQRFMIKQWMLDDGKEACIYGIVTSYYYNRRVKKEGGLGYRFIWKDEIAERGLLEAKEWLETHDFNEDYIEEIASFVNNCREYRGLDPIE